MMYSIINLFGSYFSTNIFGYVLMHIFLLAFLATVPVIIMSFFRK